jgi:uncharacterized protein (TIGR03067 family)
LRYRQADLRKLQEVSMIRFATVLVAFVPLSVASADDAKEQEIKAELQKLKGKWKQFSIEAGGKERVLPAAEEVVVTIDGDKWTTVNRVKTAESTFRIDPTQKPKTLDRIHKATAEVEQDVVDKCIYKVDGDTLTVCSGRTPQIGVRFDGKAERPKEFKTVGGGIIVVYKRVKE